MKLTNAELALIENALLSYDGSGDIDEDTLDNLLRKVRYLLED